MKFNLQKPPSEREVAFSQENDGGRMRKESFFAHIIAWDKFSFAHSPSPDFVGSSLSEGAF